MVHACDTTTWEVLRRQRKVGICEFETRLSYIVSSRPAMVRVRPWLKKKNIFSLFSQSLVGGRVIMIPFIQQYSNSFPKASKTDYHKLSSIKQQKCLSLATVETDCQDQGSAGPYLLCVLCEDLSSALCNCHRALACSNTSVPPSCCLPLCLSILPLCASLFLKYLNQYDRVWPHNQW